MGIGIAALVLGGRYHPTFRTSAMEKFKWPAGKRKDGDHILKGLGFMIINNSRAWWFKPWPFWDGEFTWPFQGGVVRDLQRSGMKRARLESPGVDNFILMVFAWLVGSWVFRLLIGNNILADDGLSKGLFLLMVGGWLAGDVDVGFLGLLTFRDAYGWMDGWIDR